jgi:ATP-dependent exoDNAse (exonuclease V) beta subunit
VILLDFAGEKRAAEAPLLFWDKNEGVYFAARDSDGERDKKSPVESRWRESEKSKDLAESKRLFYVAITRAQEKLLLVLPPEKKAADPETVLTKDNWRGWVERVALPDAVPSARARDQWTEAKLAPSSWNPECRVTEKIPVYRPRHSVTEWSVLKKCARAYEWKYIRPAPVAENQLAKPLTFYRESSFDDGEISQRELGTRVHAALERGDTDLLQALETQVGRNRLNAEMIGQWMTRSPLMQTSGQIFSELAFEIPMEDSREVVVGAIDRLVKTGNQACLIDFKVTAAEKSADAMVEAYQTQMEIYAWALTRLDPQIVSSEIRAFLVHITPNEVREIAVPLENIRVDLLAETASQIVNGAAGEPTPSRHCSVCDFRSVCPDVKILS